MAFSSIKDFNCFVHFSVSDQIKSLFTRKQFFTNIQHCFLRVKVNESDYEDIYDGSLYQKLMLPNGVVSSKNNISLTWNVDGLPLFKSFKFSLWHLYFVLNELGVMKLLMLLWFNSAHNHERYYLGRKVSIVDKCLSEINPPSIITRRPHGSEHFKFYKASEYQSFLLYYSLPVLHDILPPEYWNHYACFVVSIYNLTQQSISDEQLQYCEQTIKQFCCKFEQLYGRRYMSANIHLLLHLTQCVRELGPLWVYSCFCFESQNGILKSLVYGTQHVEKQIISSFSYQKKFCLHLPMN